MRRHSYQDPHTMVCCRFIDKSDFKKVNVETRNPALIEYTGLYSEFPRANCDCCARKFDVLYADMDYAIGYRHDKSGVTLCKKCFQKPVKENYIRFKKYDLNVMFYNKFDEKRCTSCELTYYEEWFWHHDKVYICEYCSNLIPDE